MPYYDNGDGEQVWYDDGASTNTGTIFTPDGKSTDFTNQTTYDDGSVLYTDASGNPVSVQGSNGQVVKAADAAQLRESGWSLEEIAKKFGTTVDSINKLTKGVANVASSVAQVKWFTDMKSALDKSRATYENYLKQLDGLSSQLGTLNSSDRATYDAVRKLVGDRVTQYQSLSDKVAAAAGSYDAKSMNDFMGEIANYDPQTYESLMGDIEKYGGIKRADMEQAMGQFQFFDPNRVKGVAGEIAATKTAALDRLFDRANSTGYANSITRGVDRSSLEDLRRSDVIQKFAPEYMSIGNDSFKEALAQESGLFQNYLAGRNAYTAEQTAMDNLERAGLGFTLDAALKADANERAGLGFQSQAAIAADAASRASRLQPYAELGAQMDPSLKYGNAIMGSDQLMARNTLSSYTDLAKRLAGTAAGTYNKDSEAYGDAYGKLVTALNSYANSGGGSAGGSAGGGGGGGGGGGRGFGGGGGKKFDGERKPRCIAKGIGTIASFFSSEDLKEDKKPLNVEDVLEAIKTMPVESWKYKDGVADSDYHVGPYAQDFARRFGGDGKTIDVVDAFGVNTAAIQGLARKVDSLEKRVNRK